MRTMRSMGRLILIVLILLNAHITGAQSTESVPISDQKNLLALGPMGDIFIFQYSRNLATNAEFVTGVSYTNPAILNVIRYPGTEQIFTIELGYRKYLWRNLHVEIQIDPQYFDCTDTVEHKAYRGLGLTPELRLGYRFDFRLFHRPLFFNLQWFAGYHLINPKPKSFRDVDGGSGYLSPVPMFFLGIKF